jgi:hypothetical protein
MSTMTIEPPRTAQDIQLDDTISDMCGVTMNDSVEGRIVAQVMAKKPGVTIKYYPAMIRIGVRRRDLVRSRLPISAHGERNRAHGSCSGIRACVGD